MINRKFNEDKIVKEVLFLNELDLVANLVLIFANHQSVLIPYQYLNTVWYFNILHVCCPDTCLQTNTLDISNCGHLVLIKTR